MDIVYQLLLVAVQSLYVLVQLLELPRHLLVRVVVVLQALQLKILLLELQLQPDDLLLGLL